MYKWLFVFAILAGITLVSCSKKHVPQKSAVVIPAASNTNGSAKRAVKPEPRVIKKIDSAVTVTPAKPEKPVEKEKPKREFPKVITVNDEAASKSVDGRLFYDVLGHRYWKNYSDGKYYLFDKSMYNNPDFKPPK